MIQLLFEAKDQQYDDKTVMGIQECSMSSICHRNRSICAMLNADLWLDLFSVVYCIYHVYVPPFWHNDNFSFLNSLQISNSNFHLFLGMMLLISIAYEKINREIKSLLLMFCWPSRGPWMMISIWSLVSFKPIGI